MIKQEIEISAIEARVKAGEISPVYFLCGETDYFTDKLAGFLEENILEEELRAFDYSILYGNAVKAEDVADLASRYPVGAPRQFISVREAQLMADMDKLEKYIQTPMPSTVLVLSYKHSSPDKRKAFYKSLMKNAVIFDSGKVYDNQAAEVIKNIMAGKGLTLTQKAAALMSEYMGNDLSRIATEIDKLAIILPKGSQLNPEIIERHVGISKEYNGIEFMEAIAAKNTDKAYRIAAYFSESKTSPLAVTGLLYNFFTKLIRLHTLADKSTSAIASSLGILPFFVTQYTMAARLYSLKSCTAAISVLRDTDLKCKGLNSGSMSDADIYREMIFFLTGA